MTPPNGRMVWWRQKGHLDWFFGYCTHLNDGLCRMGYWNGDTTSGRVVLMSEIEWKEYR